MKRIPLIAILSLASFSPSFSATRNSSQNGPWNSTATWGGSAVPTNADTVTVIHDVVCDTTPCLAQTLNVYGVLRVGCTTTGEKVLRVGDGTTETGVINILGSLLGDECATLEEDTDRTNEGGGGTIQLSAGGLFSWKGKNLFNGGVVTSFGAISGNHPDQKMTVTDAVHTQPSLDYYNGKVLVARSGWYRSAWFNITTGASTKNEIVLRVNDQGNVDSRNTTGRVNPTAWARGDWGMIYSTGTALVATGTTTVTFSSAFSSVGRAEEVLLGSRFACSADIGTANDNDFRRICSVTDTTHAELCTAYGTASCNPTAAFRVYDDNQPPYAISPIESFSVGDTFDIIDPAIITVIAGSQSETDQANNLNITVPNLGTLDFKDTEVGWCGQQRAGGPGGNISCMAILNVDNSNSDEGLYLDTVDIHHFSGQYGIRIDDVANMHLKSVTIRDAAEGGTDSGSEAHGVGLNDSAAAPEVANMIFDSFRIVRGDDDCWSWNLSGGDGSLCSNCEIENTLCGFTPSNDGGSVEGFEPIGGVGPFTYHDSMITNINGSLIHLAVSAPTDTQNIVFYKDVLMNSQVGSISLGSPSEGVGIPAATNYAILTGNYIRGLNGPVERGKLYDNYINTDTRPASPGTAGAIDFNQLAKGNIIIGTRLVASGASDGFDIIPTSPNTIIGSPTIRDNVVVASTDPPTTAITHYVLGRFGQTTVASFNPVIDHNTVICNKHLNATQTVNGARPNPGNLSTIPFTNNLFVDCATAINETAQAGSGDTTAAYNLYIRTPIDKSGVTSGSGEVDASFDGLASLYTGDASVAIGASPRVNVGSDGTIRGARIAGVPGGAAKLRLVYPFLADFPTVNNISGVDTDGDGVWDLFDNCPLTFNPNQYDGDNDGKGCACDASGDTCP